MKSTNTISIFWCGPSKKNKRSPTTMTTYLLHTCSLVVLDRTPKYQTSNTPNIECPNIELSEHHILDQNRTSNMSNITKNQTVREHQTIPNITFWPKTELRTC